MAGATRKGGTRGPLSGVTSAPGTNDNDDEEDEVLLVPPQLSDNHMVVSWSIKYPVECMVGNCRTKFKSNKYYTIVNGLIRLIKSIYKYKVTSRTNRCSVCHTEIGRCPANHGCFKFRSLLVLTNENCPHKCNECGKSFPNYKGLNNHRSTHKKADIQNNYNKKHLLPIVGAKRRAGGSGSLNTTAASVSSLSHSRL